MKEAVDGAGGKVLTVAFPIGGDVAGVADGEEMEIGRATELIADFKRGGFLAFNADGINAVDNFDAGFLPEIADDAEGVVEIAFY